MARAAPALLDRANELYRGVYIYNRTSQRLKQGTTRNDKSMWVRTPIMEPLVSADLFEAAQVRLRMQGRQQFSEEYLLAHLRKIVGDRDRISVREIDAAGPPSLTTYYVRFRRLSAALRKAGLNASVVERRSPKCAYDREVVVRRLHDVLRLHGFLTMALVDADPELPSSSQVRKMFGSILTAYRAAGWDVDDVSVRRLAVRRRWTGAAIAEPWTIQI